ncbi:hypothetical protein BD309DRAFT_350382 [Dichomitus squalens]|uniref:Uncharacterized protein n=1 Tax=Dichomitus squalens TaxID=114155 RepID=A0A4Q9PBU3_9APHY|nr:hypothetical protein BD309DRAFT_350382 [Dichomitus squalens]TBU52234.1 hypothetical protein BD310DRAFT_940700 [Dichomitus squalens]
MLISNRFPALRYVILHIPTDDGNDVDGINTAVFDLDWRALASALLALPALEFFLLDLYCSTSRRPTVTARFLQGLVGLQRAGKLVFLRKPSPSPQGQEEDVVNPNDREPGEGVDDQAEASEDGSSALDDDDPSDEDTDASEECDDTRNLNQEPGGV